MQCSRQNHHLPPIRQTLQTRILQTVALTRTRTPNLTLHPATAGAEPQHPLVAEGVMTLGHRPPPAVVAAMTQDTARPRLPVAAPRRLLPVLGTRTTSAGTANPLSTHGVIPPPGAHPFHCGTPRRGLATASAAHRRRTSAQGLERGRRRRTWDGAHRGLGRLLHAGARGEVALGSGAEDTVIEIGRETGKGLRRRHLAGREENEEIQGRGIEGMKVGDEIAPYMDERQLN